MGHHEHGFAAGLTAVAPSHIRPGLNAGMLLRLMLETCRTVDEALTLLHSVPVASAQTLTLADAGGASALVECSCRRMENLRPAPHQPFVCAANAFHTPAMRAERLEGVDDWAAAPRNRTMLRALGAKAAGMDIPGAMALLAGKEGLVSQYDRHSGHGTVWAVLYDLKRRAVWRAEGSPAQRRFVQDVRELQMTSLNVGYDFRYCNFLKKSGIERLKLQFYMNDVFRTSTIKAERGIEYPFARSCSFSLQATF